MSEIATTREPHKADRLTNRMRRLSDKFASRRFNRAGYNRQERTNYHKRIRQSQDKRRMHPADASGKKRVAPEKRAGAGRLRRR